MSRIYLLFGVILLTCGGLAGMQDEQGRTICDACTNPADDCDEFRKRTAAP